MRQEEARGEEEARGRTEIDGRREGDREAAKHVGFELERSLRAARKRERRTKMETRGQKKQPLSECGW